MPRRTSVWDAPQMTGACAGADADNEPAMSGSLSMGPTMSRQSRASGSRDSGGWHFSLSSKELASPKSQRSSTAAAAFSKSLSFAEPSSPKSTQSSMFPLIDSPDATGSRSTARCSVGASTTTRDAVTEMDKQDKEHLRMKWQSIFESFASKRDGIQTKDTASKQSLVREAMDVLACWGKNGIGQDLLDYICIALTSLFTGLCNNGDLNAGMRRNRAVSQGLLESLSETCSSVLAHPFERAGFAFHCIFGTLFMLLNDPGDDPGASARQDKAVSIRGGGIQAACKAVMAVYPDHQGIKETAGKVMGVLNPAIKRAEKGDIHLV